MKVIDIIYKLQGLGYSVTFRRRSDGGILITRINNRRYTGAKGNETARKLIGEELSSARREQLTMALKHRQKGISARDFDPDKEIKRLQRKINRLRRKRKVEGGGIITKTKIQYNIEQYGKEYTIEALKQQQRYAEGLAYDKNIQHLIDRFTELYNLTGSQEYNEIANLIRANADKIKESIMQSIYYDVLNKIDRHQLTPSEALNSIKIIINVNNGISE